MHQPRDPGGVGAGTPPSVVLVHSGRHPAWSASRAAVAACANISFMDAARPVFEGFSCSVFRTEHGAGLKAPKSSDAARRLRHAFAVSDAVAPFIATMVPQALQWLPASEAFPQGGVVYRWIEGAPPDAATDPRSVAASLHALHAVDPRVLADLAEPYERWRVEQIERARDGLAAVSMLMSAALARWVARVLDDLAEDLCRLSTVTVVHGDFWHENLLTREGQLTAMLDWEAAAVGDPATDLAGLWYLGDQWALAVLEALGATRCQRRRCAAWRVVRELHGAGWSVRHSDEDERQQSAAKLVAVAQRVLAHR